MKKREVLPNVPHCDCGADQNHDERCAYQRWVVRFMAQRFKTSNARSANRGDE